jgi:hypothetical protein
MRRNARERERELHFASVLETDTGGLLRLMRPVFRRIVRRAVRKLSVCSFVSLNQFSHLLSRLLVNKLMKMKTMMTTMMMTMKTCGMLDISIPSTVHHPKPPFCLF